VLVIEGPPGIGKSRLLTEVMALADKGGVRTLFGEAFEYQQAVPFFALFMATLRADPPVGDADALRRLGGSADLRYWVVHDLADAIHATAAQTYRLCDRRHQRRWLAVQHRGQQASREPVRQHRGHPHHLASTVGQAVKSLLHTRTQTAAAARVRWPPHARRSP
jgi:predicted ATPase